MGQTIHLRGSRDDVRRAIAQAVAAATGQGPDPTGLAGGVALAVGMEALSIVKSEFVVKARGGTDAAGLKWDPLKRETIAARRPPPQKRRGERPRGLLTAAQDKRWRGLFAAALRWMKGDKAHAAAYAWTVLKAEGARTRLAELGSREVEIGRDTGRMFNSLSPGHEDNVLTPERGAVVIGTNVRYAERFHKRRPLWSPPERWPDAYWQRLGVAARNALLLLAQAILGRDAR